METRFLSVLMLTSRHYALWLAQKGKQGTLAFKDKSDGNFQSN